MTTMTGNITDVPFFSSDANLSRYVLSSPPFYYTSKPSVLESISDDTLATLGPIAVYWVYSFFFHILDSIESPLLGRFRIHDSAEIKSRNLVTRTGCMLWVAVQQVVQIIMAWYLVVDDIVLPGLGFLTDIPGMKNAVIYAAQLVLGEPTATRFLQAYGAQSVWLVYWWAIPLAQLTLAMFCIDTWQYFIHRAFHVNKWLYRNVHSWHHRLYVPYAYGALYNHPLEGFLFDSLGAVVASTVTGMSIRQAALFFSLSTMKTIDDHCGYRLPLDPLQMLFGNNADYHDIHHQIAGIKSNYSQPFFIHWDTILGTRMTREELESRQRKGKAKLDKAQ